jgi:predicted permease
LRLRVRSLLRRGRVETELEKELRFHLDEQIAENVARGLTPAAARQTALRSLGGVAQLEEECRDMRRTSYIENFVQDLRYAARTLARTPGFAAVIVLTLALSIGANSAIFSVIEGVLLRPLPYPRADRIVRIFFSSRTFPKFPLNPLDVRDIRARNRSFGSMAAYTHADVQLSGVGDPVRLTGMRVTAGYFRVLGFRPARGREFDFNDELPGGAFQVILSDRVWRDRLGADPGILGRTIMLNAVPYTVIGIMPPEVTHPGNEYNPVAHGQAVDVWYPFTYDPKDQGRGSHYVEGIARLKDGVSIERAQEDMNAQVAQLAREHPVNATGWKPLVIPLYQEIVGPSRTMLLLLLGAVGLVLLIACANAANLLLARATARYREIAVRSALGAGRARLVRQMLAESLLISCVGGGLGAAVAAGGVRALVHFLPAGFPRAGSIHLDGVVLAFTLVVTIAIGFVFGLAPALQAARADLQQALRDAARGTSGSRRQLRLRNILVVAEVALACVLLIGAGLMVRSFVNLLRADPGFQPRHVLSASVALPRKEYTRAAIAPFFEQLIGRLQSLPGVEAAGAGSDVPWTGYDDNAGDLTVEGKKPAPSQNFHGRYHMASDDYFRAVGMPLLRGRFFDGSDRADGRTVVIINEAMARECWPGEDPVGKRITGNDKPQEKDWWTVVGVVSDVKDQPERKAAEPAFWWSMRQAAFSFEMTLVVRSPSDPAALTNALRREVRSMNPGLAVANVRTLDQIADASISTPRFTLFLVALFAGLALTLAAIGIYGVISYSVSRRMNEFGMRMALGAGRWSVMRLVLAQGLRLGVTGVALGLAAALGLTRVLSTVLYGVGGRDPLTFAAVSAGAILVAAVACYVPARRATAADPMTALRAE